MLKRVLAFGVCLALLAAPSVGVEVLGTEDFSLSQGRNELCDAAEFSEKQETVQSISLPPANGAWLIEMERSGGMRPGKQSVRLNSAGEMGVVSEHYEGGRTVIDCSHKEKLAVADFQKLKAALRAAGISSWRERYEDPKHPICCNQPTTRLTITRREIAEGDGGGDGTISQSTAWYPGSSGLRPADLVKLADLAQTLSNGAREPCTN